ncbi:MAG TPA: S41 family peptidase [Polyangiaceae bacterium]|nr:S41 family peptidase [Polyangiaceae bacterium]
MIPPALNSPPASLPSPSRPRGILAFGRPCSADGSPPTKGRPSRLPAIGIHSGLGRVLLTTTLTTLLTTLLTSPAAAETPDPYRWLDELGESIAAVEENYFEPVDSTELLEGAVRGMVAGLDPHSNYFSPEDLAIFEGDTSGRFGGIGVEVDFNGDEIVVIAPIEGSPAARAGIQSGDVIVGIDGSSVQDKKADELVRAMRGPIGTSVRVVLRRPGSDGFIDRVLMREEIRVQSVKWTALRDGVGYIRIKAFQDETHDELLDALGALRSEGSLEGLVLDLRNNPGGLVREAEAVADEFLSSGVIYSMRHRSVVERTASASAGGAYTRGPLVVLINDYSASAAELVAAALADHHRAQLVGTRTFGKGSVQSVLSLPSGSALKLTTALYYSPSGRTLQAAGVTPTLWIEPEKAPGAPLPIVRERDLSGHIQGEPSTSAGSSEANSTRAGAGDSATSAAAGAPSDPSLVPVTDEELHLGVARVVPTDPSTSRDRALRTAWELVRGERVRK